MKDKILEIKNKTIEFINQQKILSAVIGLTLLMTIAIIVLSTTQKNEKTTIPSNATNSTYPQSNSSKTVTSSPNSPRPENWQEYTKLIIQPTTKTETVTIASTLTSTLNPNLNTTPTSTLTPTIPPPTTQSSNSNNTSNNTQPTNPPAAPVLYPAPDSNPTSAPSSSGPQIIFIDSNGQQQTYTPPTNPPVEITWARYTNQLEKYSIDYPSNWQIITTQYRGHEAVFVYAPGADPANPNVQYISYGWSSYFYPPAASYVGTFTQDGIPGTIYTNGSMGSSFIKGVFQYYNGFLVLNNNVSDEIFAYIFNHMVLSLDFNTP